MGSPTLHRAVLAAAAAAALLLGSAAPASADNVGRWPTAQPCATGELTVSSPPDASDVTVSGWIDPCRRPARAERFGFIYYVPDAESGGARGYVFLERLRHYAGAGRNAFEGLIDSEVASRFGSVLAVCLAPGPGQPILCVSATEPDGDTPPPPVPPIQELAKLPVTQMAPGPSDPNCATCV